MPQIGAHPQQAGCQPGWTRNLQDGRRSLPSPAASFPGTVTRTPSSHSSAFERELEPSDPPGDFGVFGHGLDHSLTVAQPLASLV